MVTNWLAELDGRRVGVEVPASSANLGAGYDCLAVALGLTNRVEIEVRGWSRGEIELTVDGEGVGELTEDRNNHCVRGIEAVLRHVRGELPEGVGWRIETRNEIPLSRGLGSSAAATVAGLVAGNALLGEPLTDGDLLRLATEIEGHPDNAAPCCSSRTCAFPRRTCARSCLTSCPAPTRSQISVALASPSPGWRSGASIS
jgi:homoserine kinase